MKSYKTELRAEYERAQRPILEAERRLREMEAEWRLRLRLSKD
jgi:hypothetical protein